MEQSITPNTAKTSEISHFAAYVNKRLGEIAAFGHNWDRNGGKVPTRRVMSLMRTTLAKVEGEGTLPPHLVPTSAGGLFAEWHVDQRRLLIDVAPSGDIELDVSQDGQQEDLSRPFDDAACQTAKELLSSYTEKVEAKNPHWRDMFPL